MLEYWNGGGWAPSALDSACTSLSASPTAFAGNAAAGACFGTGCSSVSNGAVGSLYTSRVKGVGANAVSPSYSSPQFSYGRRNVMLSAPKASGTLNFSVEVPLWLKLGPTNPSGINPSASVRFGSYNSRFIFLRENY
jgi:hypothetical protein